ncbi:MAG: cytochrome c3 family protein [Pseudomonadota bacterium]
MRMILLLLALGVLLATLVSMASAARRGSPDLEPVGNGFLWPVRFAHADHGAVACTTCHHEFLDNSGAGLCFDCHRTAPATRQHLEHHFHALCRGCHVNTRLDGDAAGPVRRCSACHARDDEP